MFSRGKRYLEPLVSVVTFIEVLVGAKNADEKTTIRAFLGLFRVVEISASVARETVTLRQEIRLKIPDAVVYATARVEGCILVSRNTKELKADGSDIRVTYEI